MALLAAAVLLVGVQADALEEEACPQVMEGWMPLLLQRSMRAAAAADSGSVDDMSGLSATQAAIDRPDSMTRYLRGRGEAAGSSHHLRPHTPGTGEQWSWRL